MAELALSDFFSSSGLQFYCASSLVVLVCSFILFFILLYFFVQGCLFGRHFFVQGYNLPEGHTRTLLVYININNI